METLRFHPLIEITPEVVSSVREPLNLDEDEIEKSIDTLIEWWKKEDHLADAIPKTWARNLCERFFITSRGSLESSKRRIEKFLSSRMLFSEIILNKNFEELEEAFDNAFIFPLPKINPVDRTRVFYLTITSENYPNFNFLTLVRYTFLIAEYRFLFDYNFSDRYVVDFKNITLSMALKINPILLKKGELLITDIYGARIKGIHFVNAPPFVDKVLNLLKQVVKEKIAKRVYVHKTYDDLYKYVDKDILPAEHGGKIPSSEKISEQWRTYFKTEEAKQILKMTNSLYSNESKRINVKLDEECFGIPGSFKQINID